MDYQELLRKRDAYQEGKHLIPELTIASYDVLFSYPFLRGRRFTWLPGKHVLIQYMRKLAADFI